MHASLAQHGQVRKVRLGWQSLKTRRLSDRILGCKFRELRKPGRIEAA
jgi:hypothetical protein